ncbi:unnamed protein product [Amoebophrya sp. A120]|nr:unnamed protein product [Amoebophrya sp. A120]|eukprot:GSA120T00011769001.1
MATSPPGAGGGAGGGTQTSPPAVPAEKIAVNLGILGHIDSGKTSLCRALSTVTSTASLDKHPQSQQRGITLDLGFTSFSSRAPEHWCCPPDSEIQFCLVDCPGHASLIKTVLGGAQIIDLCCLVLDAQKGMQTQSAECLVVAELLTDRLVIVINKIDLLPETERAALLQKLIAKLKTTLAKTRFGTDRVTFCCVSAVAGLGLEELVGTLKAHLPKPHRSTEGSFLFSFDHVFPIKGQGTVMTGTVLRGSVKPGSLIDIPALGEEGRGKKVRSLQIFKKSAKLAKQGDRVAMCVPQVSATLERGLVTDPQKNIPRMTAVIAVVERLSYFKHDVCSKAKFHLTVGHQTVMAKAFFFCPQVLFLKKDQEAILAQAAELAALGTRNVNSTSTARGPASGAGNKVRAAGVAGAQQPAAATAAGYSGTPQFSLLGKGMLVSEKVGQWPTAFDPTRTYVHVEQAFSPKPELSFSYTSGEDVTLRIKTLEATRDEASSSMQFSPSPRPVVLRSNMPDPLVAVQQATPTTVSSPPLNSNQDFAVSAPDGEVAAPTASADRPSSCSGEVEKARHANGTAAAPTPDDRVETKTSLLELSSRGLSRDITAVYYVNGRLQDQNRQPLNGDMNVDAHLPVRRKDETLYQLFYLCKRAGVPFRLDNDASSSGKTKTSDEDRAARQASKAGARTTAASHVAATSRGSTSSRAKKTAAGIDDNENKTSIGMDEILEDDDLASEKKKKKKDRKSRRGDADGDVAENGAGEQADIDAAGEDDDDADNCDEALLDEASGKKKKKKKKDRKSKGNGTDEDDEGDEDDAVGPGEEEPGKKKKKKKKDRKSRTAADGLSSGDEQDGLLLSEDEEDDPEAAGNLRESKNKKKKKSRKSRAADEEADVDDASAGENDSEDEVDEADLPENESKKKKKKKDKKRKGNEGDVDVEEVSDGVVEDGDTADTGRTSKKKKKKKKKKKQKRSKELDDLLDSDVDDLEDDIDEDSSSSSSDDDVPDETQEPATVVPLAGTQDGTTRGTAAARSRSHELPEFFHLPTADRARASPVCYAYLEFEQQMQIPEDSLLIGSKLDFDAHSPTCRIAFFGRILRHFQHDNVKTPVDSVIDVVKMREKVGILDKCFVNYQHTNADDVDEVRRPKRGAGAAPNSGPANNSVEYTVRDMFSKDTDLTLFLNLKVMHESSGVVGVIESSYGVEGHVRVRFERPLPAAAVRLDKKGFVQGDTTDVSRRVLLHFKKFEAKSGANKNRIAQ